MARGDFINRNNIPTPSAESGKWDSSGDWSSPNATFWISAPVIVVQLYTNASGLASNSGTVTIYKWNGIGTTSFTQYASGTTHGGFGADDNTWRFVHNCSESYNSHDDSNIHLWKIVVSTSGGGTKTLSLRAGSIKSNLNSNSNTYASGNLIRACKPELWSNGATYSSDAAFVNGENPLARRGTWIDMTNANYVYGEY